MQADVIDLVFCDSRQYLPRKGTETPTLTPLLWDSTTIDSRQYLPRKGTETLVASEILICFYHSRQYLPRKGTETLVS